MLLIEESLKREHCAFCGQILGVPEDGFWPTRDGRQRMRANRAQRQKKEQGCLMNRMIDPSPSSNFLIK
jgi:hypothetical protein